MSSPLHLSRPVRHILLAPRGDTEFKRRIAQHGLQHALDWRDGSFKT
jgi:hypothetical protein